MGSGFEVMCKGEGVCMQIILYHCSSMGSFILSDHCSSMGSFILSVFAYILQPLGSSICFLFLFRLRCMCLVCASKCLMVHVCFACVLFSFSFVVYVHPIASCYMCPGHVYYAGPVVARLPALHINCFRYVCAGHV
jgi:hypothetical protein